MLLKEITPALINKAIEIYLACAYEDQVLREANAVRFDESMSIEDVLATFERDDTKLASYVLRLGCQHYPHMKLALWEAYFHDEYVFAVDRHDGFDFNKTGPDYDAWCGIKSRNYQTRDEIERAWYEAGVPTMRSLKEKRMTCSDVMRVFSGHYLLLVDNDYDSGAIMQMILSSAGYGCLWASGVKEALEILEDGEKREACGLALVDVMLNDGSGLDVVKAIRARPETQNMPIILTSAMNDSDVLDEEVDVYLRKPYSAQDLTRIIAQTIRRKYDGHDMLVDDMRPEDG